MRSWTRGGMLCLMATLAACGSGNKSATADTSAPMTAAANPSCSAPATIGNPVVSVQLDADAARLERLQVIVLKDPGRPLAGKLESSAGEVECTSNGSSLRFSLRGAQTSMALTVHAPAETVYVSVQGGGAYGGHALAATGPQEDILWGQKLRDRIQQARRFR